MRQYALGSLLVTGGATTLRVPQDFATIQAALNAAGESDTVLVAPGTYVGPGNVGLRFGGVDKVLRSSAGAAATEVGADENGNAIDFDSGESAAARVEGFTLKSGNGDFDAVVTCLGAAPTLSDCVIESGRSQGVSIMFAAPTLLRCTVRGGSGPGVECVSGDAILRDCLIADHSSGGGVRLLNSDPTLIRCTIAGNRNQVSVGGGMYCSGAAPWIANCVIADNRSDDYAGGIYFTARSNATLLNCTITGNTAPFDGGGIDIDRSSVDIRNCTVSANHSNQAAGISIGFAPLPVLTNCIVWGNSGLTQISTAGGMPEIRFSDVGGGWAGPGNIDADPGFRSRGPYAYLLRCGSPCIDTGAPSLQDSVPWPSRYHNGTRSDMGAYGGPGARDWWPSL